MIHARAASLVAFAALFLCSGTNACIEDLPPDPPEDAESGMGDGSPDVERGSESLPNPVDAFDAAAAFDVTTEESRRLDAVDAPVERSQTEASVDGSLDDALLDAVLPEVVPDR